MSEVITPGVTVRLAPSTESPHPAWKLRVGREYLIVDSADPTLTEPKWDDADDAWLAWVPRSHTDDPCAGSVITLYGPSVTVVVPALSA